MHKITIYHLRFFAYFSLATSIIMGKYVGYLQQTDFLILLALALTTPNIGYLSSLTDIRKKTQDQLALIILDAIVASIIVLVLGEYNTITLIFILIIVFNTYLVANIRYTLLTLFILFSFTTAWTAILDPYLMPQPPTSVVVTAILFAGIYFCMCAKYVHEIDADKEKLRQIIASHDKQQQIISKKLSKYVSPQVWESIFGITKYTRIETQRKKLTVFFSDIKDFTQLSEELESESLTELLNHYLTEMSNIAQTYNGTIDKFVGDSIMIFFGDTNSLGAKKDAIAATSMALAMQNHMKVIRNYWHARGVALPLEIRMGINTGFCTVGNFGASTRMDYTIIGREVNLASRLENAAKPGEILISEETYALIKDVILCRDKGEIAVKGFSRPIRTYEVVGLRQNLGADSYYVEHETKGFSVYMDSINIKTEEKQKIIAMLEKAVDQLKDS